MTRNKLLIEIGIELEALASRVRKFRDTNSEIHKIDIDLFQNKVRNLYDKLIDLENSLEQNRTAKDQAINLPEKMPEAEIPEVAESKKEESPGTVVFEIKQTSEVREEKSEVISEVAKPETEDREEKEEPETQEQKPKVMVSIQEMPSDEETEKETVQEAEPETEKKADVISEISEPEIEPQEENEEPVAEERKPKVTMSLREMPAEGEPKEEPQQEKEEAKKEVPKPGMPPSPAPGVSSRAAEMNTPQSAFDLFTASAEKTIGDQFDSNDESSIAQKMQKSKITDLKQAIGINEKFLFINELFNGDLGRYNKAIDEFNELNTQRGVDTHLLELKIHNQWQEDNEAFMKLKSLLDRKFD